MWVFITWLIQTYSFIPSSSLKSKLSSLRSKNPLLFVNTSCLGSWSLWMMFASCMLSPHELWWPSSTHTSSCRGLNPQQLWSRRLCIWGDSSYFSRKYKNSWVWDLWLFRLILMQWFPHFCMCLIMLASTRLVWGLFSCFYLLAKKYFITG